MNLPKVTQDYVANGAIKGSRNNSLFDAAGQYRDARYTLDQSIQELLPRARQDGLPESEIRSTIKSAFSKPPRDRCCGPNSSEPKIDTQSGDKPTYRKVDFIPESIPPPLESASISAIKFLEATFEQGEWISIGEGYEKKDAKGEIAMSISEGRVRTREAWIADISQNGMDAVFPFVNGIFVRINPMTDGNGTSDKDVALYRDILAESDKESLEHQLGAIRSVGLPISALVYSGDRSVQAHFRVNAPDEDTYRERYEILRKYCGESLGLTLDVKNKNPSRYSRLPGAKRTRRDHDSNEKILDDGKPIIDAQTLLAINLSGKSWDDWLESLPLDDGARQITVTELREFDRHNDPNAMFGDSRWACAPGSVVVQGPSGIGKSALAMQWVICSALGKTLLEIPCFKVSNGKPKKIMVIQAENDDGDLAEPYQDITAAMELSDQEHALIEKNVVFLYQDSKSGKAFIEFVRRRAIQHKPNMILADPLLSYIGGDIIQQVVMSDFLRIQLNPIIREFALLWIWIQHTGKPRHDGTERTHEEKKYAGLSSSELTNWAREVITMTELPDNQCELSFGKRWRRTGILNAEGYPVKSINIKQSDCGTVWQNIEGPPTSGGFKVVKSIGEKKKVTDYIVTQKSVTRDQLKIWASQNGVAQNVAVTIAKALVDDESDPRIYCYKVPGKSNTNKGAVYTTIPPIL